MLSAILQIDAIFYKKGSLHNTHVMEECDLYSVENWEGATEEVTETEQVRGGKHSPMTVPEDGDIRFTQDVIGFNVFYVSESFSTDYCGNGPGVTIDFVLQDESWDELLGGFRSELAKDAMAEIEGCNIPPEDFTSVSFLAGLECLTWFGQDTRFIFNYLGKLKLADIPYKVPASSR